MQTSRLTSFRCNGLIRESCAGKRRRKRRRRSPSSRDTSRERRIRSPVHRTNPRQTVRRDYSTLESERVWIVMHSHYNTLFTKNALINKGDSLKANHAQSPQEHNTPSLKCGNASINKETQLYTIQRRKHILLPPLVQEIEGGVAHKAGHKE